LSKRRAAHDRELVPVHGVFDSSLRDALSQPECPKWCECAWVVTCVDGFGPPGSKIGDYEVFDHQQLIEYPGMKLFYRLDKPLMSPRDALALNPPPLMVMYQ
jgi:hypothetical protein